jgi:ribosomal protein S15P/S13E
MLIKKAVAVRKHLSTNRKDRDGKLYVSQCACVGNCC